MAKADPLRNYYSDLDISPQADTDEIKKQYRKLALKYHPDRNPGHEEEFSSKFQAIQSAHEILTDPQERAKYDASRRRIAGAAQSRPAMGRKNPYETTSYYPPTEFPPPPRRTQTQKPTQRPSFATSQTSAGARRYADWQKAPTQEKARPTSDQYKQYQNAYAQGKSETSEPASSSSPPKSRQSAPSGPPPSMNRSQSTRATPRKAGFDPLAPGDEPPAKTASAYYNIARGDRPAPDRMHTANPASDSLPRERPPVPPRDAPKQQFATRVEDFSTNEPRIRTPYANSGGEKINVFSDMFGRSASMHEGSGTQGPGLSNLHKVSSPASDRHRSVSPPRSPRYATDYANGFHSLNGDARENLPRRTNSAEDPPLRSRVPPTGGRTRRAPFLEPEESEEEVDGTGRTYETIERMEEEDLHRRSKKKNGTTKYTKPKRLSGDHYERSSPRLSAEARPPLERFESSNIGKTKSRESSGLGQNRKDPSIFSMPVNDESFTRTSPHVGSDAGSSRFPSNNWEGKVGTSGDDHRSPQMAERRGRAPARDGSFHKMNSGLGLGLNGMGPAVPPKEPLDVESPRGSKFVSEQWVFDEPDFLNPADGHISPTRANGIHSNASNSRLRGSKSRKGSKVNKRPGASKQANVVELSEEDDVVLQPGARTSNGRASGHSSGRDSSAMDIDPPTPQPEYERRGSASRRARADSYDKGRPDYPKQSSFNSTPSSSSRRPVPPPPVPPRAPSPPGVDMGSLKNVEPLGRTNSGLHNLKDLASELPFESRASAVPPLRKESDRPSLPYPPKPPPTPSPLNRKTWESYIQEMKVYVTRFNQFNQNILAHFEKSQDTANRMPRDWVQDMGESEKGGYLSYMRTVDDDVRWRTHWSVACDRHQDVLKEFGRLREKVREKLQEIGRG